VKQEICLKLLKQDIKTTQRFHLSIFSSRLHQKIGEGTIADAEMDRIVHITYEMFIDGGNSMRKKV
jgi:hypothetical protein